MGGGLGSSMVSGPQQNQQNQTSYGAPPLDGYYQSTDMLSGTGSGAGAGAYDTPSIHASHHGVGMHQVSTHHSGVTMYGRDPSLSSMSNGMSQSGITPASTLNAITQVSQRMQIPLGYADAIIGVGGANITYVRRVSGASVTVQEAAGLPGEMAVEIRGSAAQVQTAQTLIQNFMAGQSYPTSSGATTTPSSVVGVGGYSSSVGGASAGGGGTGPVGGSLDGGYGGYGGGMSGMGLYGGHVSGPQGGVSSVSHSTMGGSSGSHYSAQPQASQYGVLPSSSQYGGGSYGEY